MEEKNRLNQLDLLIKEGEAIKVEPQVSYSENPYTRQTTKKTWDKIDSQAFFEWSAKSVSVLEGLVPQESPNFPKVIALASAKPSREAIRFGLGLIGMVRNSWAPLTQDKKNSMALDITDSGEGSSIEAHCNSCRGLRLHRIQREHVIRTSQIPAGGISQLEKRERRQIIECGGCKTASFILERTSGCIETMETFIWPPRERFGLLPKDHQAPKSVLEVLSQTIRAFNQNMLVLASAGLRTVVEIICIELHVKRGLVPDRKKPGAQKVSENLDGKINGLAEKGIITADQAGFLQIHRFIGNDAVHDGSPPPFEDMEKALEILVAVIDQVWKHPIQSRELEISREKRRGNCT